MMNTNEFENSTMMVIPAYTAPANGKLTSDRQKEEYAAYRKQYQRCRGVMPEFDMLNKPAVAIPVSDVLWPTDLLKAAKRNAAKCAWNITKGFLKGSAAAGAALMGVQGAASKAFEGFGEAGAGMLYGNPSGGTVNTELAAELVSRFEKIIDRYKYVYELAFSGYGIGLCADESIVNINDGLGYVYDAENGAYQEGTWGEDGLMFGLTVSGNNAFYGDHINGVPSEGILVIAGEMLQCGKMNEDCLLECEEGFTIDYEQKMMWIGPFASGVMNGMCISYNIPMKAVLKTEFVDGMAKRGVAGWLAEKKGKLDTVKKTNERRVETAKGFLSRFSM